MKLNSSVLFFAHLTVLAAVGPAVGSAETPEETRPAARTDGSDALSSLEKNPSPAATRELSRLLRDSKNPDARLWLVNALYERVLLHRDAEALSILEQAAKDDDANVRRTAVSGVESFEFLPVPEIQKTWLSRVKAVAARAQKDRAPVVRTAGLQLQQAVERWEKTKAPPQGNWGTSGRSASPEEEYGNFWSRLTVSQAIGLALWMIAFHFLAYVWQELSVRLLKDSGSAGAAVFAQWKKCREKSEFLAFPTVACLLLLLFLGGSLAYGLLSWAAPIEDPMGWRDALSAAGASVLVYAVSVLIAFVPAAALAGFASRTGPGGFKALFQRHHALVFLGMAMMIGVWPWELVLKLCRRRIPEGGVWRWAARTGAPLAGALAAVYMIRENIGWRHALQRAAERHSQISDPAAAFFGTPLFQPQFALPALAAPVVCGAALLPAILLAHFSPAELFGWWFVSDGLCVAGFAVWAGIMMSAAYLAVLWSLGGLYAAELAMAPVPTQAPVRRNSVRRAHV